MNLFTNLGPHASFIVTAYSLATLAIAAMIAWVVIDYRAQRRKLEQLEARGITRRSGRAAETTA